MDAFQDAIYVYTILILAKYCERKQLDSNMELFIVNC